MIGDIVMDELPPEPVVLKYYSRAYLTYEAAKADLDRVCGYEYNDEGALIDSKGYFADLEPFPFAEQTGINPITFEPTSGPAKWYYNIYNTNGEELNGSWIYTFEVKTPYRTSFQQI